MKRNFRFFIALIFFLLTIPLSAQTVDEIQYDDNGGEVMSLFEIERLIRRTDYTEALKQLNLYIEKKPDYFDNAQRLIKIIMNRRQQYSILAERAIKSSSENPEDHETPAKIILQMRSIEKNPPAEIKRMIDMLEEMHLFKYYAYLFDTIQEESAQLTDKGEYFAAIHKVRDEGFDIYREEYFDRFETEHSEMIEKAQSLLENLNNSIARYEDSTLHKEYDTITAQFIKAVNEDNYSEAMALYPSLEQIYQSYAAIRNEVYQCGEDMRQLYALQIEIDPEITDASYLPFMQRFILGIQQRPGSGILGAIDTKYNLNMEKMKAAVTSMMRQYNDSYLAVLPEKFFQDYTDFADLSNGEKYAAPLERYSSLGQKVNALYSLVNQSFPQYDVSFVYQAGLARQTSRLMELSARFENEEKIQQQLLEGQGSINELFDSVFRMSTLLGNKNSLAISAFEWSVEYRELGLDDWHELTGRYNYYLDELFELSAAAMTDSWTQITQSYKNDADAYVMEAGEYNTYAKVYSDGFDDHLASNLYSDISSNAAAALEYAKASAKNQKNPVYHYPELAQELCRHSVGLSDQYITNLEEKQTILTDNLNAHEDWLNNKELAAIVNESVAYMQNKKALLELNRVQSNEAIAQAQLLLQEAEYNKKYAESILDESRAALAIANLSQAESLLLDASEKYSASLAIADSEALRNEADTIIAQLSSRIMDAKNEIVIRESRALYTQAREALNYDRYDVAEILINSAINKWSETHTEKNPEFEDFLELVNTAVSMKTGRVLVASDPLYSEMSQLLSIAYQYYDEGSALIKSGRKAAAEEALNSAVENLNKFKAVYPLNQEASLLLLKIDRLREPARFDEEFAQKVQVALAQSKNKETMAQAYNTLTDYYNLVPDYKGLKDAIYNLEIDLGMRQKPVDNSAATRSTRLTSQAQSQFNSAGSDTAKLNRALELVNEALKLNPNNSSAQTLKDRISLKIGSSSIIVLSSDDQNLLTQAKKAYQNGNIDDANTYMLRLLNNNPNNIKLKEVEDLNNKIKSQL